MAANDPKQAALVEPQTTHLLHAPKVKRASTTPPVEAPIPPSDKGDPVPIAVKTRGDKKRVMSEKRRQALVKARRVRRENYLKRKQAKAIEEEKKEEVYFNEGVLQEQVHKEAITPFEPPAEELEEDYGAEIPVGEGFTQGDDMQYHPLVYDGGIQLDLFEDIRGTMRDKEIPTIEDVKETPYAVVTSPFTHSVERMNMDMNEIASTPMSANISAKSVQEQFANYDSRMTKQSLYEYMRAFNNKAPSILPAPGLETYRAGNFGGQPSFLRNISGARNDVAVASDYMTQ